MHHIQPHTQHHKYMSVKKLTIITFIFIVYSGCLNAQNASNTSKNKIIYYEIEKIVDGDTFWIKHNDGSHEKIRFIGIDAPETKNVGKKKKHEFGNASTQFLSKTTKGRKVTLSYDVQKKDRFGRTLAYVYLDNGIFLNDYLVKNGYAWSATFPPNVNYQEQFLRSERYARQHKLGLWKE